MQTSVTRGISAAEDRRDAGRTGSGRQCGTRHIGSGRQCGAGRIGSGKQCGAGRTGGGKCALRGNQKKRRYGK